MIHHYFQSIVHSFSARPVYYIINITGLAIGIAACILISHYVWFHKSFDRYQENSHRTYRLNYWRTTETGEHIQFASATPTIGRILKDQIPEIEALALAYQIEASFSYGDKVFHESGAFWADASLLELLGIEIISGDPESGLAEPGTISISRSAAEKYFGEANPIGKTLIINQLQSYTVTSVFEDLPPNTHFAADILISMETVRQFTPQTFTNSHFLSGYYNYVLLKEGAGKEDIDKKIAQAIQNVLGSTLSENKFNMGIQLQPIEDIHLKSKYLHELKPGANAMAISFLEIVAWFVLIIAWVNFINLSTIQSIKRLREIGMRKVAGATRWQLTTQFFLEAAIINILAILCSLIIIELTGNFFSHFTEIPDILPLWRNNMILVFLGIAFLAGTVSAGFYSVIQSSKVNVNQVLKSSGNPLKGKGRLRKILVVSQFSIAMGLLLATMGTFLQYRHISDRDTGFRLDNMLVVRAPAPNDTLIAQRINTFKNEVADLAGVSGITFSSVVPGQPIVMNIGGIHLQGSNLDEAKNFRFIETDTSFFEVYEVPFLAGSGFSGNPDVDNERFIINETSARLFGFVNPKEAIGRRVMLQSHSFEIAGVVKDYHHLSPKEKVEPLIFWTPRLQRGYFTMSLNSANSLNMRRLTENIFRENFPNVPFDYFFLDDYYHAQNKEERRFGMVFAIFSFLSVFITIMGLLGLAAFTAEQKKKEISIRKVIGASERNIFTLLLRDYAILWGVSAFIALPAGFFFIERWLTSFAVRINISFWLFAIPAITVLTAALMTVFAQSYKTVRANPAETLKCE